MYPAYGRDVTNRIADGKKQISLVLTDDLLRRVDGRAAADGTTRVAVVNAALESYLAGLRPADAAAARLDAIDAKLDALVARAEASDASARLAYQGIVDAVRSQPVQVAPQLAGSPDPAAGVGPARRGRLARIVEAWRG